MVTTRLPIVAEALTTDRNRTYNLPVLTEEFALMLLRILVPEVVSQNERDCLELVRDLEGLPLALHVAAGLLRTGIPSSGTGLRRDPGGGTVRTRLAA